MFFYYYLNAIFAHESMTHSTSLILIDNEDSFTWNLVQLFKEAGAVVDVRHPASINEDEVQKYDGIIISPGPGLPDEMSGLHELIRKAIKIKPVLGVCLGMQAIVTAENGSLFQMDCIVHGNRTSIDIFNNISGIFKGMDNSLYVGLYHSWAVDESLLPDSLLVTARSKEGVVMAIEHKTHAVYGVQFHPESYITEAGLQIAKNFLDVISLRQEWKDE